MVRVVLVVIILVASWLDVGMLSGVDVSVEYIALAEDVISLEVSLVSGCDMLSESIVAFEIKLLSRAAVSIDVVWLMIVTVTVGATKIVVLVISLVELSSTVFEPTHWDEVVWNGLFDAMRLVKTGPIVIVVLVVVVDVNILAELCGTVVESNSGDVEVARDELVTMARKLECRMRV